ncbi:uncharacterized protein VTP21DRAFT_5371 [Calcarisporiella thermophila]|uniref:uncharacterized protein n=1 Tax=Calcarisporiella thermophila TaxID=911321 RepID=UPI0037430E39
MELISSMLPTEKLRRAYHRRYCDRSLGWDLKFLNLPPILVAKVTECADIPQQHPHPRLPLYHCHLAGKPVAEYTTRQGRHSQRNGSLEPNTLVPRSWSEVGSITKNGRKCGPPFTNDPPSQNTVLYDGGSLDTIRYTFFECPELTPVWQWAERCIVTITGLQNSQVLSARNLILGDLSESSRTAKHVAQIIFDSELWQIHRDRIAFHFENTRASSETIINRVKLDIEEAIGAELIRAREKRQIEQFLSRRCKLGVIKEGANRAVLELD